MGQRSILPDDILEEILSRLSVKQLVILRCVSKSWCALIDDVGFMKKHYKFKYARCTSDGYVPFLADLMVHGCQTQFYIVSKDQDQDEDNVLNLTDNLHRDFVTHISSKYPSIFDSIFCTGVINGIVWVQWDGNQLRDTQWALWNPATRDFMVVPRCSFVYSFVQDKDFPPSARIVGFGFDPIANDFKIIVWFVFSKIVCIEGNDTRCVYQMYSLRTNSWKTLTEPSTPLTIRYSSTDAYLNGLYYWASVPSDLLMVSFNFSTEIFKIFDAPDDAITLMSNMNYVDWMAGVYRESLALIVCHNNGLDDDDRQAYSTVDIWIVIEFDDGGIPLTWQHLFTVGPIPPLHGLLFNTLRSDGDMLLTIWVETQMWDMPYMYNPSSCIFKKLGSSIGLGSCYRYVESLFPLSKRHAIS